MYDDEAAAAEHGRGIARDRLDVDVRVLKSGAIEPLGIVGAEAVIRRIERGMLTSQQESRREVARPQRSCNGCEFDGFRASTDDERDAIAAQLSP